MGGTIKGFRIAPDDARELASLLEAKLRELETAPSEWIEIDTIPIVKWPAEAPEGHA